MVSLAMTHPCLGMGVIVNDTTVPHAGHWRRAHADQWNQLQMETHRVSAAMLFRAVTLTMIHMSCIFLALVLIHVFAAEGIVRNMAKSWYW